MGACFHPGKQDPPRGAVGRLKGVNIRKLSGADAGQPLLLFVCLALFCGLSSGVLLAKASLQTHLTQRRNRGAHPCRLTRSSWA